MNPWKVYALALTGALLLYGAESYRVLAPLCRELKLEGLL